MNKNENIIGKKFGKLTVLEELKSTKKGDWHKHLKCLCECGRISYPTKTEVLNGRVKSCGCRIREIAKKLNTTHGLSKTRIYNIWQGIKARCFNKNLKGYKNYGGRGVIICNEWLANFMNFYNWSINNGYQDNLTIDRIDNNGNYEPNNCRWVDMKTQQKNRTNNNLITYNGKTLCLIEWERITGIKSNTIRERIKRGWTIKQALETPKRSNKDLL